MPYVASLVVASLSFFSPPSALAAAESGAKATAPKVAMAGVIIPIPDIAYTKFVLKDAQNNDTLGLPGSFETVQQLAGAYSNILEYDLPDDYYNTFTQKVLELTPEGANAMAKRLVLPDHLIWVVVGDMSKVEAGIRELNLGEVHKIDADGNPVN
jgi:hypothetical protein